MKIAIVTFEFEGLTKNGGIGTAFRRLTDVLLKDGHQVTLVFLPFDWSNKLAANRKVITSELRSLARQGVRISMPEQEIPFGFVSNDGFHHRRSLVVYEYLKTQNFDLVHAPDNCGLIYHSLLAKKSGLAFAKTQFAVGLHGAPFWTAEANGNFSEHSIYLSTLDRPSIEMCDYAISPSRYMVKYLKSRGWKTPKKTLVIPNANQLESLPTVQNKNGSANKTPKSLVFFGRLERRKGIFLFVEALHHLMGRIEAFTVENPLEVTFLGSESSDWSGRKISDMIQEQMSFHHGRVRTKFLTDYSSEKSLTYLKSQPHQLVCMPSLIDNSPYVIVEAIEAGLDFLATTNGGQSELMRTKDAAQILCAPNLRSLVTALEQRLFAAPIEVKPSSAVRDANQIWSRFHKTLSKKTTAQTAVKLPRVSIVIGTHQRGSPTEITQTLKSVLRQNYSQLELVVADNLRPFVTKLARGKRLRVKTFNSQLHCSPAVALEACTGQFVLFLDGGVLNDRTTLQRWSIAGLTLAKDGTRNRTRDGKKYGAYHGLVSKTFKHAGKLTNEITIAAADDPARAMTGACMGSSFALWQRDGLLKISRDIDLDFSSDSAARNIYSHLIAAGYRVGSMPLLTIHSLPSRYEPHPQSLDQTSVLAPFWKEKPEAASLYAYVAGLYQELSESRNERYRLRERLTELEEMKSEIKRAVQ